MGKVKDLTGQKFGRLTVVKQSGFGNKNKHGSRYAKWLCKCDCGNYCERTTDILKRSRNDHSCGCLAKEHLDDMVRRMQIGMKRLPSAQPERIIHCKDCKHFVRDDIEEYAPYGFYNTYFHAFCDKHWDNEQGEFIDVKIDDFCSFAERREVTT